VYNQSFRALRGLLLSLVKLLGVKLPIPCYTRICRRAKELGQQIKRLSRKQPTDIVFDSTGLKVYGEGEWKVRQLAVYPENHDIILGYMTDNDVADCEILPEMQNKFPKSIKKGYGDGAYGKTGCYRAFHELKIQPVIPPQRGSTLQDENTKPWMRPRNNALKQIADLRGDDTARKLWKRRIGYHRRSIAETAMYRFKALLGGKLQCRKESYQKAEIFSKYLIIN